MNRNRTVAGLDVHKNTIYLCIMDHEETVIFERAYGVLTPELRQMRQDMTERGVTEAAMESTAVYWVPVWNELCEAMDLNEDMTYNCNKLLCKAHFPKQYDRVQTIPRVKERAATAIITETGADMRMLDTGIS